MSATTSCRCRTTTPNHTIYTHPSTMARTKRAKSARRLRRQQLRERMTQAMRVEVHLSYQTGISVSIDLGAFWVGVALTILISTLWPELSPLLKVIPTLSGISLPTIMPVIRAIVDS